MFTFSTGVLTVALAVAASLAAQEPLPARPGEAVEGVLPREGEVRYRLAFSRSGPAVVEVSGAPADCRFQVGSQGFQEPDSSPAGWTDGQPGQPVRHVFQVQAGRPGILWVRLLSRASGMSVGAWSGVACTAGGPYYTSPGSGTAPASVDGHPVRPPISFRLVTLAEGASPPVAASRSAPPAAKPGSFRDDRLGFSIDYSDDWVVSGPEKGTVTLTGRSGAPAAGAVITVTAVPKTAVPNSSDFQILLRMHERLTDMGATLTALGGATVGGRAAVYAGHIYDDKDLHGRMAPFDHLLYVAGHGAYYYLLAFVAPHEVFARQTESFKRIFHSWRFLP